MSTQFNPRRETLSIECDLCGETDVFADASTFGEGMQDAFRNGWRAWQEDKVWTHSCPPCAKQKEW